MIYRLHENRVLPCCRIFIEKNPYFTPFFFNMNCIQMALTATMSGLMSDRVHPKVDVI